MKALVLSLVIAFTGSISVACPLDPSNFSQCDPMSCLTKQNAVLSHATTHDTHTAVTGSAAGTAIDGN